MQGEGRAFLDSLAEWKGEGDFTLDNIRLVLKALGNPQDKTKVVHVAGTNGKGSVSASMASILGASGQRVGLTVSPHLSDVSERILVDGYPCGPEILEYSGLQLKQACSKTNIRLSFFEGMTACAFLAFAELSLDWMVLETGLGGRLDATNVIKCPEVSAIVTIDRDHEHILGSTLGLIAKEKAGILKQGSKVVLGPMSAEPLQVIEKEASRLQVPFSNYGRDFTTEQISKNSGSYSVQFKYWEEGSELIFSPSLRGLHQGPNLAVAIKMAKLLGISNEHCIAGVENVFWPGRLELVPFHDRNPFFLDCAHNVAGIKKLIEFLDLFSIKPVSLGFGVLDTKNWKEMVQLLVPYVSDWNLLEPESSRALKPQAISDFLSCLGISSKSYGTHFEEFVDDMQKGSGPIVVTGSMYMIGKLRPLLRKEKYKVWNKI